MNLPKDKFCKEFSYNQKEEKAEVLKQLLGSMGTIGAGSVVTKDIPSNATAAGNYAKVLNFNNPGRYVENRWACMSGGGQNY